MLIVQTITKVQLTKHNENTGHMLATSLAQP